MKNQHLKNRYDEFPWAFERWETHTHDGWIQLLKNDAWPSWGGVRLKPILPDHLPEPTDEMMNRAVYVGQHIEWQDEPFAGWWINEDRKWSYTDRSNEVEATHFCVDITDPVSHDLALRMIWFYGATQRAQPLF